MSRKKLFFDMDGVLVDFKSGIERLSEEEKCEYGDNLDNVPGIFSRMDPIPGAIEAVHRLSEYYDVYILSTAPWNNPTAWNDKIDWLKRHFGDLFKKRVMLTHCKNLCDGDYLVDDNPKNGASEFPGEWIHFGSEIFPNWESVTNYLISITLFHELEEGSINRRAIDYGMVEKTIKALDSYMKVLEARYETEGSNELYKEILQLTQLTNKWLIASGEVNESEYYID